MKKIRILLLTLAMAGFGQYAQAQQVFNYLLQKSESIINAPKTSDFDLKVNQFKATALRYIPNTGIRLLGGVTKELMDQQAYHLNVFLTSYFADIKKTNESNRKECIMQYVKATRLHPLFEDKDIEKTEAFVNDPGGYTPFSINVNWQAAVEEVNKMKKGK